ncbi:hypothetical protein [Simiduia agarivorans]|nr:hypothetical protein [Simiduia agarivorans]
MKKIALFLLCFSSVVDACCDNSEYQGLVKTDVSDDASGGKVIRFTVPESIDGEVIERFGLWLVSMQNGKANEFSSELKYVIEDGNAVAEIFSNGSWNDLSIMVKYTGERCPPVLVKNIERK